MPTAGNKILTTDIAGLGVSAGQTITAAQVTGTETSKSAYIPNNVFPLWIAASSDGSGFQGIATVGNNTFTTDRGTGFYAPRAIKLTVNGTTTTYNPGTRYTLLANKTYTWAWA